MKEFFDQQRLLWGECLILLAVKIMPREHPHTEVWASNILYAGLEIEQDIARHHAQKRI